MARRSHVLVVSGSIACRTPLLVARACSVALFTGGVAVAVAVGGGFMSGPPWPRGSRASLAHSSRLSRARLVRSASPRLDAMVRSRLSTAASALARRRWPLGVKVWVTLRLSSPSGVRSTRPLTFSPSTTAVIVGRRTARRCARADGGDAPSAKRPKMRYWGSDSSTSARANSSYLESHAAARP